MRFLSSSLVALSLALALPALAADTSKSVFHSSFAASFDAANEKIIQLANAFTDEQLAWRPAEGVRSTREAIMHVVQANFFLASKLGATLPADIKPGELGNFAGSRTEMVALLKQSIDFAKAAVAAVPESEMGKDIQFFGQTASQMRYILILVEHAHEHLGQLIAYARSNGVTPPWSK